MGDEASADTSSFLVTIERISRLGILRGLERVRDCFGRKRGDVRQGMHITVRPCPGSSNGCSSRWNKNLSGEIEINKRQRGCGKLTHQSTTEALSQNDHWHSFTITKKSCQVRSRSKSGNVAMGS